VRGLTTKEYQPELEALYSGANAHTLRRAPKLESPYDIASIEQFVRACASSFLSNRDTTNQDDLFILGLDSLQTLEITNGLKAGLGSCLKASDLSSITSKTIYANPTVEGIARFVNGLLNAESVDQKKTRMGKLVGSRVWTRWYRNTLRIFL
jgi:acyl carrier protein